MIKKVFLLIWTFFLLILSASALTCIPDWDGDRTVEWDCDYPAWGYKVRGDITVGDYTVTIPDGEVLGIDLSTNKITFWNGKILIWNNAKIDNSVSNRYDFAVSYTVEAPITNCPAWTEVLVMARTWFIGTTPVDVAESGTMYCAKP